MSLTAQQLANHVGRALEMAREPAVFAYAWPQPWVGSGALTVQGQQLPVRYCDSVLQIREELSGDLSRPAVLLVSVPETQLGQDVLARIFRQRLLHVDRWQMLADSLGVKHIDSRLFAIPWMADALLNCAGDRRPASVTALTYDEALALSLGAVFGREGLQIDLETLQSCCERSAALWLAQATERRTLYRQFLVSKLGSVADALLGATEAGFGAAILGLGLVCEVLYHPDAASVAEIRDARVRLEPRLGGIRLKEADGRRWSELARAELLRREDSTRQDVLKLAVAVLRDLGITEHAVLSSVLPESLEQRLEALGEALRGFLKSSASTQGVESAVQFVLAHGLTPKGHPGPQIATMVARLVRREASAAQTAASGDLVDDYLKHGAWEDWARRCLRGTRPELLARAVSKLLDRIEERRMDQDRQFATQLAQAAAHASPMPRLLPIESALSTLVAPLAAQFPVTWIVLDGMSWDVYLALTSTLAEQGWESWQPATDAPSSVLATVPSVTECSRASLLAGLLLRGPAANEKSAFEAHPLLRRSGRGSHPPRLLHKAQMDERQQLSVEASKLLADPDQRVVGIVINAIDDALAKSEQMRIDWDLESIPLLASVLDQSRLAGRVVLLSSDHGHVLERHSEYRRANDSERWRAAGAEPGDGEIRIGGARVRALVGSDIIVPWTERLRYANKKNGYHGGVTRQEMLVPFGIWTFSRSLGENYVPQLQNRPHWWEDDGHPSVREAPPTRAARQAPRLPQMPQPDLFSAPRATRWVDQLLASPTLARQREKIGRLALDDERLRTLLDCIDERGGRVSLDQLAAAVQLPMLRMRGVVSTLQRMVNLDGFQVIAVEQATNTVSIDLALLRTQFEL